MSTTEQTPEELARQAYHAAVRLLGRRDHSIFELRRKLSRREHGEQAILSALEELTELNYVNDHRYAELFTQQRVDKGYGPLAIRARLRERGIDSHLINKALAQQQMSWSELAQAALEKRFSAPVILSRDASEEARMSRFLASRGFSGGDALKALHAARKEINR